MKEQIFELVNNHFQDKAKTTMWFCISNPCLKGFSPQDLIDQGRGATLLNIIEGLTDSSKP